MKATAQLLLILTWIAILALVLPPGWWRFVCWFSPE